MIDLSGMKGITIDAPARTARVEAGCTWGEVNDALQPHGLAATGGFVSVTGVSGLTLGGGLGWLVRKHGLALDNLLSAEVVLADGRLVTASTRENEDLFWAIRGGGGNFGVVTSFEFQVHPVGTVLAGIVLHPAAAAPGPCAGGATLKLRRRKNLPKVRFCFTSLTTLQPRRRCAGRQSSAWAASMRELWKRARRS